VDSRRIIYSINNWYPKYQTYKKQLIQSDQLKLLKQKLKQFVSLNATSKQLLLVLKIVLLKMVLLQLTPFVV
jgi:hypothetical protein